MLRCLIHGPGRGAWNMAVDEALMDTARAGRVTLRLYGWQPGCLSFGRNQTARGRYDGARAARRGIDVVRRPTGGRSVFHRREITYSVTAPAGEWGGLREAYLKINQALAAGLRRLGVPVSLVKQRKSGPAPRPSVRACFRDPLPGEVVADGRKLVGSAQWRDAGALLQHGSLLLYNDQSTVESLEIGGSRSLEVPATALSEYLEPLPGLEVVAEVMATSFGTVMEMDTTRGDLTRAERVKADAGRARYEDEEWTWRR